MSNGRVYGKTDLPLEDFSHNRLGDDVRNYVNGLTEFVLHCNTPMSIALQGGWGTGKTTFINAMMKKIDEENEKTSQSKVAALYFNTWQYSRLNQSDDLYSSLIIRITSELKKDYPVNEITAKNMLVTVGRITYDIGKQYVKNVTGYDVNLDKFLEHEQEKAERIGTLKDNFAKMIKEAANDNRVIIFIDDLDRLNPEKAVELLEVMKLFMDVEKCVFVLAVDYEVVVKGIKAKYGSEMTDDKCRSFFDKIIQVPFRMPIENYRLDKLLEDIAGDRLGSFSKPLTEFIKITIGSNPRAFKRLFNSFDLISLVNSSKAPVLSEQCDNALLFASLVIQIASSSTFEYLLKQKEQDSFYKVFVKEPEEGADYKQDIIDNLKNTLDEIYKKCVKYMYLRDIQVFYDIFAQKLTLSSVTAVIPEPRFHANSVDRVIVFTRSKPVETATEAIKRTFELVLSTRMPGEIYQLQKQCPDMLTLDYDDNDKFFPSKMGLATKVYGAQLFIDAVSDFETKKARTQKLCEFFKLPSGTVKWFYKGEEIFCNIFHNE